MLEAYQGTEIIGLALEFKNESGKSLPQSLDLLVQESMDEFMIAAIGFPGTMIKGQKEMCQKAIFGSTRKLLLLMFLLLYRLF